eukprot:5850609-Pleurochrysis_carterae.AAC.1
MTRRFAPTQFVPSSSATPPLHPSSPPMRLPLEPALSSNLRSTSRPSALPFKAQDAVGLPRTG